MKRISLVIAMLVLVIGIPVQAQKKNRPIIQPPPGIRPAGVLIQSDTGEGYMTFDLRTGAFLCNLCEYGYAVKGTGEVRIDGVNVYFSVIAEDYSVFASVNLFDHQGKCVVEIFNIPGSTTDVQPLTEYLIDSDMMNSKAECLAVPEK